jgi:hypothetical protein
MTTTETKLAHGDPFAATRPGERREVYAWLAEQAPVQRVTWLDGEPAGLVTQYDVVRQALADPRLVKRRPPGSVPDSGLPPDLEAASAARCSIGIHPSTPGCASWCRPHSLNGG